MADGAAVPSGITISSVSAVVSVADASVSLA
jgi:hypothetical protein